MIQCDNFSTPYWYGRIGVHHLNSNFLIAQLFQFWIFISSDKPLVVTNISRILLMSSGCSFFRKSTKWKYPSKWTQGMADSLYRKFTDLSH